MSQAQTLHIEAMQKGADAFAAQRSGDYHNYLQLTKQAFEKEAAWLLFNKTEAEPTRAILFRSAAQLAFNCGKMREAEQLISAALRGNPPIEILRELRSLYREVLDTFELVAR